MNDKPTTTDLRAALDLLASQWKSVVARSELASAACQKAGDEVGRRFIENGAMCYFNCAAALRAALGAPVGKGDASDTSDQIAAAAEAQVSDIPARWLPPMISEAALAINYLTSVKVVPSKAQQDLLGLDQEKRVGVDPL